MPDVLGLNKISDSRKLFWHDFFYYLQPDTKTSDSEKQEGCGEGAHERLIEPQVTMQWLLAKPRSFSNIPAFLDINGN